MNTANFTLTNNFQISGDPIFTPPGGTTQTISGIISNATGPAPVGVIDMEGAGTLVLSGINTYSGGTVISSGTVRVTNNSSVGTGLVTLDGGTFQAGAAGLSFSNNFAINPTNGTIDTQANTLTLSGTIADGSGAGALTKIGGGTLILTGTDTYSGGTTITAGILQLGNGGTTGSIVGNVTDNGTLAVDSSSTVTLGGTINGTGGVNQIGSGTTVLTATNGYLGATNVNNGALEVNGSIASSSLTTVASGATLFGAGTVGNTQINGGGTFAPGTPGVPMTVTGNLALASASIYMVTINGANTSGANVSNTATITNGALFKLANGATPVVNTTYTVLTATNGVTGTFADPMFFFGSFEGVLSYTNPDDVFLTIKYGSLAPLLPPGLPTDVINVANGIDNSFQSGNSPPANFQNLFNLSQAQLVTILTQLAGQPATGAATSSFQLMTDFFNLVSDMSFGGGGSGAGGAAPGFAPEQEASFPPDVALAYNSVLRSRRRNRSISAGPPGARALAATARSAAMRPLVRTTSRRALMAMPAAWTITPRRTSSSASRWPAAAPIGI